nr:helix-turn-helix domain-containing protein [Halegenticoccus soli]
MEDSHRYHAYPTQEVAERLEHQLDVHRQLYNHVRWDYVDYQHKPTTWLVKEYDVAFVEDLNVQKMLQGLTPRRFTVSVTRTTRAEYRTARPESAGFERG